MSVIYLTELKQLHQRLGSTAEVFWAHLPEAERPRVVSGRVGDKHVAFAFYDNSAPNRSLLRVLNADKLAELVNQFHISINSRKPDYCEAVLVNPAGEEVRYAGAGGSSFNNSYHAALVRAENPKVNTAISFPENLEYDFGMINHDSSGKFAVIDHYGTTLSVTQNELE